MDYNYIYKDYYLDNNQSKLLIQYQDFLLIFISKFESLFLKEFYFVKIISSILYTKYYSNSPVPIYNELKIIFF